MVELATYAERQPDGSTRNVTLEQDGGSYTVRTVTCRRFDSAGTAAKAFERATGARPRAALKRATIAFNAK